MRNRGTHSKQWPMRPVFESKQSLGASAPGNSPGVQDASILASVITLPTTVFPVTVGTGSGLLAAEESITAVTMNYNVWRLIFDDAREYLIQAKRTAATSSQVAFVDVTDPTTPSTVDTFNPGSDRAFCIGYDPGNQRLYLVNSVGDTFFGFNVANTASVATLGSRDWGEAGGGGDRTEMYDAGDTACTYGDSNLRILDVSTPSGTYPILASLNPGWGGSIAWKKIDENRLCMMRTNASNLAVVDLSTRTAPSTTWNVTTTGRLNHRICGVTSDGIWVPIGSGQYRLIDYADGSIIDTFTSPLAGNFWIDSDVDQLFMTSNTECCFADVSNPASPVYSNVVTYSTPLYASDNYIEFSATLGLAAIASMNSSGSSSSAGRLHLVSVISL